MSSSLAGGQVIPGRRHIRWTMAGSGPVVDTGPMLFGEARLLLGKAGFRTIDLRPHAAVAVLEEIIEDGKLMLERQFARLQRQARTVTRP
jgi:hypothetical protein